MKAIRKMINGNKGFMSFMLIFFFLSAGLARNLVFTLPPILKAPAAKTVASAAGLFFVFTAADTDEDSGLSFLDQLKDSDADDVEFAFYGNYTSRLFTAHSAKHLFTGFAPYRSIYKVPLYDLFCNWKFHLS